jgi:hypothetical protein
LRRLVILLFFIPSTAAALDFSPREFNVYLSSGRSPMNFRGHSVFRTIHFEVAGESAPARRWLHGVSSFFFIRRHE